MNLQEISKKYQVSDAFLNSKEDGLTITSNSLKDLVREISNNNFDNERKNLIVEKLKKLSEFCLDVKNSGV